MLEIVLLEKEVGDDRSIVGSQHQLCLLVRLKGAF
jgi:hypothetical protein